jgi:hypothetical protein
LQSLYPGNDAGRLAALSASYFAAKPDHSLYLHENNYQTTNALFPFRYNGFRVSLFTRNVPLAATLW